MSIIRLWFVIILAAMTALPLGGALAAGSSSSSSSQEAAEQLDRAETMIESGDFRGAIPVLQDIVESDEDNADAYNYLGFAYRNIGEYDRSRRYYDKALSIDSQHKGAREYLGELYLKLDQLDKAEQQLARLDEICPYGCEEYDELAQAIEEYRQSR